MAITAACAFAVVSILLLLNLGVDLVNESKGEEREEEEEEKTKKTFLHPTKKQLERVGSFNAHIDVRFHSERKVCNKIWLQRTLKLV